MNFSSHKAALSKISGEFKSESKEEAFLVATWQSYRTVPRNTLLVLGIMTIIFLIRDVLTLQDPANNFLFPFRIFVAFFLTGSAVYIHRSGTYFKAYHLLLLLNQVVIAVAIFLIAMAGQMPVAYQILSTIGLTLLYYLFINNKFGYTVIACAFQGVGTLVIIYFFYDTSFLEIITAIIFLLPLNILGDTALCSLNRTKRREYLALLDLQQANNEKERLIQELQLALAEVNTLQGFIPICANCHNIRNDEGFWEKIEQYIQDRTEAQFSHGICPDCAKKLYPEFVG